MISLKRIIDNKGNNKNFSLKHIILEIISITGGILITGTIKELNKLILMAIIRTFKLNLKRQLIIKNVNKKHYNISKIR